MIYLKEGQIPLNFACNDEIVQEGNSKYQLSFKFPTNNPLWEELVEETLLLADDLHGEQEFIIFEVEKHHAYITIYANQVATLLNNYSITELSVNNASGDRVMRSLVSSIIREHKFTFSSDVANTHSLNLKNVTVANALFKDKHSIIGQWGGDLIRDKYDVRLLSNGGTNKEALFMYKKNLKSYQQKKSIKDLRTRIHFTKTINSQKEGEKDKVIAVTVDSLLIGKYKNIYEGNLDVSDQDVTDEATLRKYGENYFKTTLCDVIEESIEIDVVGIPDEPVGIFDTVTIFHEKFNLDVKKKITKYTYSPMGRKLKTIGFGKIQSNLGTTLASMVDNAIEEKAETMLDAFKIQKNLAQLLKLDRKGIEDKLVELEEKSKGALEVKKALFETDGTIPDVVKTKILDAVEGDIGRLKTIITEAELIKAIQAKLNYAEIKNALIDKAFINQIISDEKFTQQFEDGEVTTQNIFTKLKDSIKSNISKDFVTEDGVKKLVNDITIDADGIRQITQQESSKVFEKKKAELKGVDSYIHKKYSDNADGRDMSDNSTLKYIGIYTGDKEQAPTNASEYSWSKIRGEDGQDGKSINENLLPNSNFAFDFKNWEDKLTNSGLNYDKGHAITHFGRGLYIYGTANADYKGFSSVPFNLIAKQGDKLTLSMDLGKDALTQNAPLKLALHYIDDKDAIVGQEWKTLDLATQNFEVKKYKRISMVFTVQKDIRKCRVMIYATNGQLINFYIDNIKLERGEVATEWNPAYEDLQGHSLTANLRFDGRYVNNVVTNLNAFIDVFYDGQKITEGFELKVKHKGMGITNWTDFISRPYDNTGRLTNFIFSNGEKDGTPLEAIVLVTYKGLNTIANERLENVPDVTEIKETVKKYKIFENTLDRFNSTIGQVKEQVVNGNRNYITNSGSLNDKSIGSWNKWEKSIQNGTIVFTKINGSDTTGFFLALTDLVKTEFQNETMTWSIDVRASRNCTFNRIGFETNGQRSFNLTTQWQRISHTFVNKFVNYYAFTFYNPTSNFNNGDKIYIRFPKLEKGNIATEWTVAPEDVSLLKETTETSIEQTNRNLELKVSKDNVIASINASVEKNEQGQNQGIVKIKGEVLADNIHGKTFTGSKFKIGQYGFLQPIEKGLQINAPENFGSKRGIGLQIAGEGVGPKENGVPPGLFIYENPDFTRGNTIPDAVNRVLLTVAGMACFSSRILGSVVKGQPILTSLDSNFPFSSTYPVKFIGYQEGGFMRFFSTDNDSAWNIKVDTWGSDRKLKTDIKDSEFNAIEFVEKLNFKEHGWNKDEIGYERPHTKCGLIAQEVQELDESLVVDYGKYLGLDGLRLINISLKAIQELSTENQQLKSQLNEMNERLNKLEGKINGNI